jgi:hypothetical protein
MQNRGNGWWVTNNINDYGKFKAVDLGFIVSATKYIIVVVLTSSASAVL